jgi:hypothetical protein
MLESFASTNVGEEKKKKKENVEWTSQISFSLFFRSGYLETLERDGTTFDERNAETLLWNLQHRPSISHQGKQRRNSWAQESQSHKEVRFPSKFL